MKNILTLSNDLKYLEVTHNMVAPGIIEETMFLSNKQLERIKIGMFIQEIREWVSNSRLYFKKVILLYFHRNSFLYLERLKELTLVNCGLQVFNPNELPSSIEILDLSMNQLQKFDLTKPLVNLKTLDLSKNFLTKFILDMKDFLPKIRNVSVQNNKILDFQPIDNKLNHTLRELNLNGNQIRNINTYKWILETKSLISCEGNFPICDCSYEETLDKLYGRNIVHECILPVPGDVHVKIRQFFCSATDPDCIYFTGLCVFYLKI